MRVLCWPGLSGAPVGCDFVKWVRVLSPTSTGLRPADHAPRSSETSDLGSDNLAEVLTSSVKRALAE